MQERKKKKETKKERNKERKNETKKERTKQRKKDRNKGRSKERKKDIQIERKKENKEKRKKERTLCWCCYTHPTTMPLDPVDRECLSHMHHTPAPALPCMGSGCYAEKFFSSQLQKKSIRL